MRKLEVLSKLIISHPTKFTLVVLVCVALYLQFPKYIEFRPIADHTWAQCDRASVARNYAQESMNFFLPRVHYTAGKTGISGLEFPIINYSAAILYKIFGFHERYYRLIMLLLVFSGLFAIFKLCDLYLNDIFLSVFVCLAWYLSPLLVCYTPNFIPDAGSLGLILVAWYGFFKSTKSPSGKFQLIFLCAGLFASLIKLTALISVISILSVSVLNLLLPENKKFYSMKLSLKYILYCFTIIGFTYSWYTYASYLNDKYESWIFLMKSNPPQSYHELIFNLKYIWSRFHNIYFSVGFYIMFLISLVVTVVKFRKVNPLLFIILLHLYLGSFAFLVLMNRQFIYHEYYFISLLPVFFFQILVASDILRKTELRLVSKWRIATLFFVVITVSNAISARKFLKGRFSESGAVNSGTDSYLVYHGIEPYLRKLGIRPEQEVLSYFDQSPNVTLYFLNQKGWTIPFGKNESSHKAILNIKADYIIFNDRFSSETILPDYIKKMKIGQYKTISIYKKVDPPK